MQLPSWYEHGRRRTPGSGGCWVEYSGGLGGLFPLTAQIEPLRAEKTELSANAAQTR
jgi:hypothetical protein